MIFIKRRIDEAPIGYVAAAAIAFNKLAEDHGRLRARQSRLMFDHKILQHPQLLNALDRTFHATCAYCESPLSTRERAATIRTLGLNRAQLVDQRLDTEAAVIDGIEENRQKDLTDRERARLLKELYRLGKSRAPFCGMVRTLIHHPAAPELTWEQIEATFEPA